jgi:tetratricopeptide (TPR) repeat protein
LSVPGLFAWLAFLRHRRWLLLALFVLGAGGAATVLLWAEYHFRSGEAALAAFQNDQARDHLEHVLQIWPRSVPAHLLAARADRRAGRFAEAGQHLDECRKWADAEATDDVAFEWALLRASMGDLGSVKESLEARLLARPFDGPLIWEALAEGYRRNYRMPEALQCLDTWLWFQPDNVHVYYLRGELHRQVGAVGRARDEYRRVVDKDAQNDEARRQLARCLVQVGHYREAGDEVELLLRKYPGDPQLGTLLARCQHDLGQRAEAIALLDDVLRGHSEYGPALRERARIALAAEQYADAESWLRRALGVLPNDYEVNFNLHRALQGLGRSAEAQTQLARAQQLKNRIERLHEIQTHEMTLHPFAPELHAELGELLVQNGQREPGERWLHSALQLDPNLRSAHAALAALYETSGDTARAAPHRLAAGPTPAANKE